MNIEGIIEEGGQTSLAVALTPRAAAEAKRGAVGLRWGTLVRLENGRFPLGLGRNQVP